MFSAATHRLLTIQVSKYTDTRVFGQSILASFNETDTHPTIQPWITAWLPKPVFLANSTTRYARTSGS